jgi:hypothetical protein
MIFHYLNAETTFIQFKFRAAHIANALAPNHRMAEEDPKNAISGSCSHFVPPTAQRSQFFE